MPSFKHLIARLQEIGQELAQREEQETSQATGKPTMYIFVYEKQHDGEAYWGPYSQDVYARSLAEAFQSFGNMLDTFGYQARNINYGPWEEMREAEQQVSTYWQEWREKKEQRS